MIKLNKPGKGSFCWSISKAALKEFKVIRIKVDDESDEAIIKTIDRGCKTDKWRNRKETTEARNR